MLTSDRILPGEFAGKRVKVRANDAEWVPFSGWSADGGTRDGSGAGFYVWGYECPLCARAANTPLNTLHCAHCGCIMSLQRA